MKFLTNATLRHTAASWMAQAHVDFAVIARYLGRSNRRTTERVYAHHNPDYLKSAVEALDFGMHMKRQTILTVPSQKTESSEPILSPWKTVVGATGIEPVTPTMSR